MTRLVAAGIGTTETGALVTRYGYDEVGDKITQTDALGRVTAWTYDAMGRELTCTLLLGQVEAFAFDDAGQRTVHVDFKGVTTRYGYAAARLYAIDYATVADVFTPGQFPELKKGQVSS